MKAYQSKADVATPPSVCDHCGADALYSIGLVAPKCAECGQFSMSHITFGPMEEVEVDLRIIVEP